MRWLLGYVVALVLLFTVSSRASNEESVQFESLPDAVSDFQRKRALAQGKSITSVPSLSFKGILLFPDGNPPYANIILLHGCTADPFRTEIWAKRLVEWGFSVLSFDGFTPRGLSNVCNSPVDVPAFQRAKDAQGAVNYLSRRGDIDVGKIAVLGLTHGATSTLYALTPYMNRQKVRLKAAAALYPNCGPFSSFTAPLWAIHGEFSHISAGYRCDQILPRVPTEYSSVVRTHYNKQHPTEYFAIDDTELDSLTVPKSKRDHDHLQSLRQFLLVHLK